MRALVLVLLASCWTNSSTASIRIVYRNKYIHDVPRDCLGLPEFPSITLLDDPSYVEILDTWIDHAAQCLYVKTYPVKSLLETVTW